MMRVLPLLAALVAAAPAAAQQPSVSARVYELNEVEVLPRPQNVAEFTAALRQGYPPHLQQAGVGGTVHLAFVVGADGQPVDVRVVSTPDSAFGVPSTQAISLLRFSPAQVQGRPVAVRVEQPITWRTEAPSPVTVAALAPAVPPSVDKATQGYELEEVEVLPCPLNREFFGRTLAQSYPSVLREDGRAASVQVRLRVEVDGTTSNYTVLATTHPAFADPTLRALPVLRFSPARLNGQPVRVWVELPIEWSSIHTMPLDVRDRNNRPMFGGPNEC
jgi:TonB family protein